MSLREKLSLWLSTASEVAVLCVAIYLFAKYVLVPIAPIITAFTVLIFTIKASEEGFGTLAWSGIVIYLLSFPLTDLYGYSIGLAAYSLGMLTWFGVVFASFGMFRWLSKRFAPKHDPIGVWP